MESLQVAGGNFLKSRDSLRLLSVQSMHAFPRRLSYIFICLFRIRCSEFLLLGDHGLDTVVHVLDEIDLRATKSSLVGNVIDVISGFGVLSVDASNLDVELVSDGLECWHLNSKLRELNMDRSSKGSSKVGGARSDVTEAFVMSESGNLLNLRGSNGKSRENGSDVSTLLHRDDSKLVLFIDPDEEGFLVVVEDTSSLGPVSVKATCLEESVSFFEEEVIGNKLGLLSFSQRAKRVECSFKLTLKGAASLNNFLLNLISLFPRDSWAKRVFS